MVVSSLTNNQLEVVLLLQRRMHSMSSPLEGTKLELDLEASFQMNNPLEVNLQPLQKQMNLMNNQ